MRSQSRITKFPIVNTEQIAQAIGGAITGEIKMLRMGEVNSSELKTLDLLIIGSPTHAGRATPAMKDFLKKVSEPDIKGINVAAFDTRLTSRWVRIFGFAAGKIAKSLKKREVLLFCLLRASSSKDQKVH